MTLEVNIHSVENSDNPQSFQTRLSARFPQGHIVWGERENETLISLHKAGKSFTELAEIFNTTRNAIAGKCKRLGLVRKEIERVENMRKPRTRTFSFTQRTSQEPKPVIPAPPKPDMLLKELFDLGQNDCRWVEGDGPYLFCGHQKKPGSSYCPYHSDVVFQKVRR